MTNVKFNTALIVGVGSGLSASLARALAKDGINVALAARTTGDLDGLVKEVGGRAQSMARELSPQGIHVAHVVVDGGIRSAHRPDSGDSPDSTLDPDAIAGSYMHLIHQPRSAWAWEIELRPWVEKF